MNAKKFSDAMSELDNKYIDEALNYKKKVKKPIWIKWGAMVASLLLVFTMSVPALAAADFGPAYVEYVYDLSDVDLTQYKVYGYFVTSDTHIEGNWSVTFPLESISQ